MGYFKDEEIAAVEAINAAAMAALETLAPTLSELYCDESAEELIEIWNNNLDDVEEEARADYNPMASKWKRFDCFYANRLMNELAGFLIISMENDW